MSSDRIAHSEFPGFSLKNIMERCVVVHGGCDSTRIAIGKVYFSQSRQDQNKLIRLGEKEFTLSFEVSLSIRSSARDIWNSNNPPFIGR
jgi:hypothetical protein